MIKKLVSTKNIIMACFFAVSSFVFFTLPLCSGFYSAAADGRHFLLDPSQYDGSTPWLLSIMCRAVADAGVFGIFAWMCVVFALSCFLIRMLAGPGVGIFESACAASLCGMCFFPVSQEGVLACLFMGSAAAVLRMRDAALIVPVFSCFFLAGFWINPFSCIPFFVLLAIGFFMRDRKHLSVCISFILSAAVPACIAAFLFGGADSFYDVADMARSVFMGLSFLPASPYDAHSMAYALFFSVFAIFCFNAVGGRASRESVLAFIFVAPLSLLSAVGIWAVSVPFALAVRDTTPSFASFRGFHLSQALTKARKVAALCLGGCALFLWLCVFLNFFSSGGYLRDFESEGAAAWLSESMADGDSAYASRSVFFYLDSIGFEGTVTSLDDGIASGKLHAFLSDGGDSPSFARDVDGYLQKYRFLVLDQYADIALMGHLQACDLFHESASFGHVVIYEQNP